MARLKGNSTGSKWSDPTAWANQKVPVSSRGLTIQLAASSIEDLGTAQNPFLADDVIGASTRSFLPAMFATGFLRAESMSGLSDLYVSSTASVTVDHDLTHVSSVYVEDGGTLNVGRDLVQVQHVNVDFGGTLEVDHSLNNTSVVMGIGGATLKLGKEVSIVANDYGDETITQHLDNQGDSVISLNTTPSTSNGYNSSVYSGSNAVTFNVLSTSLGNVNLSPTLTVGSPAALAELKNATINLGTHTTLASTFDMAFGSLTVNAGSPGAIVNLTGESDFAGTAATFNAHVIGSGTMVFQSIIGPSGAINASARFNSFVGPGVTVILTGNGDHAGFGGASLTIASSPAFDGTVEFNPGKSYIDLQNLGADSYNIKGDILSLFSNNKMVDTLHVVNDNNLGNGPSPIPLTVEHNAFGILIATGGEDRFQVGGIGTALMVHN